MPGDIPLWMQQGYYNVPAWMYTPWLYSSSWDGGDRLKCPTCGRPYVGEEKR